MLAVTHESMVAITAEGVYDVVVQQIGRFKNRPLVTGRKAPSRGHWQAGTSIEDSSAALEGRHPSKKLQICSESNAACQRRKRLPPSKTPR